MRSAPVGRLQGLWRYPVKSLRGEALVIAELDALGLVGDRRRALIVATAGTARSGKPYRGKEHARLHTVGAPAEAGVLAAERGLALGEVSGGSYVDDAPVSLVVDGWLAEAERLVGRPLEALRFRPNLLVAADGTLGDERDLVGATLALGTVQLHVVKPIVRCVTITYDLASGAPDPRVLTTLARDRASILGVYCEVAREGRIALGDAVHVA